MALGEEERDQVAGVVGVNMRVKHLVDGAVVDANLGEAAESAGSPIEEEGVIG